MPSFLIYTIDLPPSQRCFMNHLRSTRPLTVYLWINRFHVEPLLLFMVVTIYPDTRGKHWDSASTFGKLFDSCNFVSISNKANVGHYRNYPCDDADDLSGSSRRLVSWTSSVLPSVSSLSEQHTAWVVFSILSGHSRPRVYCRQLEPHYKSPVKSWI